MSLTPPCNILYGQLFSNMIKIDYPFVTSNNLHKKCNTESAPRKTIVCKSLYSNANSFPDHTTDHKDHGALTRSPGEAEGLINSVKHKYNGKMASNAILLHLCSPKEPEGFEPCVDVRATDDDGISMPVYDVHFINMRSWITE